MVFAISILYIQPSCLRLFNSAHIISYHRVVLTLFIDQENSPLYNVILTSLLVGWHGNTAVWFSLATILVSLGMNIRSLSVKKRERALHKHHILRGKHIGFFGREHKIIICQNREQGVYIINITIALATQLTHSH